MFDIVSVSEGKLKGGRAITASGYKYHEFLSVPYAKPPVGDLRFKVRQKWYLEKQSAQLNKMQILHFRALNHQNHGTMKEMRLQVTLPTWLAK